MNDYAHAHDDHVADLGNSRATDLDTDRTGLAGPEPDRTGPDRVGLVD